MQRVDWQLYDACSEGLAEKPGLMVFQFPPKFIYTEERLKRITYTLNPAFINVVEFRHSSCWNEEVYSLLKRHSIVVCSMSHPQFPEEVAGKGSWCILVLMVYLDFIYRGTPI